VKRWRKQKNSSHVADCFPLPDRTADKKAGLFRADVSGNRYSPDKIVNHSLSNEVKEDIRRGYTVNIKCLGLVAV